MALSRDTLALLTDVVAQIQLPVGHPEFESQALRLITAKRELAAALAATEHTDDVGEAGAIA